MITYGDARRMKVMKRGFGPIERRVLKFLNAEDGVVDTKEIVARVFDCVRDQSGQFAINRAQAVSVRRALRALADEGKVADLGRHWGDGRRRWSNIEVARRYTASRGSSPR